MRGVVWTDVFQACIMMLGLIIVIAVGSNEVGGLINVLYIAQKGNRTTLFEYVFISIYLCAMSLDVGDYVSPSPSIL